MKVFLSLLSLLAFALLAGVTSWAQNVGDNSSYFVTYYSIAQHTDGLDQTVRVINDGDTGANLWASFYVFDDSQEMQSCCSCEVTPDGLTSESVQSNLTGHSLTGKLKTRGVIKMISSSVPAAGPTNFTNNPTPGLRVWATHIQRETQTDGPFFVSESQASAANLVSSEKSVLETLCYYVSLLGGNGPGICTCTPEDNDF